MVDAREDREATRGDAVFQSHQRPHGSVLALYGHKTFRSLSHVAHGSRPSPRPIGNIRRSMTHCDLWLPSARTRTNHPYPRSAPAAISDAKLARLADRSGARSSPAVG